ncbi:hypothetical protein PSN45_003784 [Yamadazyma tenuis]|nr:hypothetical protein PSN45_003784 [Yamadazyma tenuis]
MGTLKEPQFRQVESSTKERPTEYHVSRIIGDYGFVDLHSKRSLYNYKPHYHRPFQTNQTETISEVIRHKKKQAEYDMDEQDSLYLEHRNRQPENTLDLSPEVFEIAMTILENLWMDLESQMKSLAGDEETMAIDLDLDGGSNINKYGHDDGIVFGTVDDQKCAVCNDSDGDNTNAIVFCDGCNIAVHQECYGVAFIPEGSWLCRKCMINQHKQFDCCFCPSKTGAFKQLDNSLWSHVVCGLWINELYFANPIYLEPIEGIDSIPKSRWKLTCYICKQKMGACVQCSNRSCFQAYHVTCAKRAQLYMSMTKGFLAAVKDKSTLKSFCDKHTPTDYILTQNEIIDGINKARVYFRDLTLLNLEKDKLDRNKQLNNKLNMFKWKTESNTPIAPRRFSQVLSAKLFEMKLDSIDDNGNLGILRGLGNKPTRTKESYLAELEQMSNDICRYWCLKRESKNGAPLIRKNNNLINTSSILYGSNTLQEVQEKLDFGKTLVADLEKVIHLSDLSLHRQYIQQQLMLADQHLMQTSFFPVSQLIRIILQELTKRYDSKKVLTNWKSRISDVSLKNISNLNDQLQIHSVAQLQKHLNELNQLVVSENKLTNNVVKVCARFYNGFAAKYQDYIEVEADLKQLPAPVHLTAEKVTLVDDLDYSDLSEVDPLDEGAEDKLVAFLGNGKQRRW